MSKLLTYSTIIGLTVGVASCSTTQAPAGPSSIVVISAPRIISVTVTTPSASLFRRGQTVQATAAATLSNGFVEDRSGAAQWQSTNSAVASVNSSGVLTAGDEGETTIRATVEGTTGTFTVTVRYAARTLDPAPGQKLPLPDIQNLVAQFNNERPGLINDSCPGGVKYRNNPWLDYIVDRLRTIDTRWGYNAKPTRTAVDNGGLPVIAAGDEIAYNFSADPDEGTTNVYLIDILESHCGTPRLTYRHFTGEEPGRWTAAGRF